MTVVKGSRQHRVKVISHRPLQRWCLILSMLALASLAVYAGLRFGHKEGMSEQQQALEDIARLRSELSTSSERNEELEQVVANINLGAEVDRKANEDVRQKMIQLNEKIAQLEEENGFYRGLMSPTKNKQGLDIGSVEISQTERTGVYNYKVVMQQLANNHQLLSGTLEYKVVGRTNGEPVSYFLNELSSQVDSVAIKLRFKYFQTIEGEMQIPLGFEPEGIDVVARSTGKNAVTVERRFGWLVEEIR
ncbi:MAG: hypothetical protein ACI9Y1_000996 [Lentisphaeria bacterium]|jgi:hypothetical protein